MALLWSSLRCHIASLPPYSFSQSCTTKTHPNPPEFKGRKYKPTTWQEEYNHDIVRWASEIDGQTGRQMINRHVRMYIRSLWEIQSALHRNVLENNMYKEFQETQTWGSKAHIGCEFSISELTLLSHHMRHMPALCLFCSTIWNYLPLKIHRTNSNHNVLSPTICLASLFS